MEQARSLVLPWAAGAAGLGQGTLLYTERGLGPAWSPRGLSLELRERVSGRAGHTPTRAWRGLLRAVAPQHLARGQTMQ